LQEVKSKFWRFLALLGLAVAIGLATRFLVGHLVALFPEHERVVERVVGWIGGMVAVLVVVIPVFRLFDLFRSK
jgi:hypothetical protein